MDDKRCVERSSNNFMILGKKVSCLTRRIVFGTLYGYCKASEMWSKYKSFYVY